MSKKSPSVPKPEDPKLTIAAQAQANKDAIIESYKRAAIDLFGPTGSTVYQRNSDGTPKSQTTTLTPGGQWLYDAQQAISAKLANAAYDRVDALPKDAFSLKNIPYKPNYNTAAYDTFSPIMYPRDMKDADTSFAQPNKPSQDFFNDGSNGQGPAGGGGKGQQAQQMMSSGGGGKGAPSQPPASGGDAGAAPPAAGPAAPGAGTMPTMPGTSGYKPPAPGPTPEAQIGPWSFGQPLKGTSRDTPLDFYHQRAGTTLMDQGPKYGKKQDVTGYGLSLAQKYADPKKFKTAMADPKSDIHMLSNNYNIKNPADLAYVQRTNMGKPTGMPGKGGPTTYGDTADDKIFKLQYQLDHQGPRAAPQPTAPPVAPPPTSVMPTMPGRGTVAAMLSNPQVPLTTAPKRK
jgi:hypothetical protein